MNKYMQFDLEPWHKMFNPNFVGATWQFKYKRSILKRNMKH